MNEIESPKTCSPYLFVFRTGKGTGDIRRCDILLLSYDLMRLRTGNRSRGVNARSRDNNHTHPRTRSTEAYSRTYCMCTWGSYTTFTVQQDILVLFCYVVYLRLCTVQHIVHTFKNAWSTVCTVPSILYMIYCTTMFYIHTTY